METDKHRDQTAFAEFYRRNFKLVYQICLLMLKNVPDAEDAGVWDQVAALPPRDRLILYLFYYQGYSTGEIAELLGEKPSTLRCQLTRARQTLKLRLEAEGYGP